jgi:hypothetical protein
VSWLDSWIEDARGKRTNEDEAFEAARREAAWRFEAGHLANASSALMDELEREEKEEKERQEERRRRRLRLLEEAIRFDELAFNGEAAAEKLRLMAQIEGVSGMDELGQWLHDKAGEFLERGDQKGENGALVVAVAAYRAALEERTRERVPLDWASNASDQGEALILLSERCGDIALAEQALSQITAALELFQDASIAHEVTRCHERGSKARTAIERLHEKDVPAAERSTGTTYVERPHFPAG